MVARVILGFGTCAGYPAAMYLIRSEAKRTGQDSPASVLTALAVSSQTIAVVGPTLGGLLIGFGGWRTIFAVNIPLAIVGIILGLRRLPKHDAVETGETRSPIDVIGMVLFAGMLTALLLFLMNPRIGDWSCWCHAWPLEPRSRYENCVPRIRSSTCESSPTTCRCSLLTSGTR